MNTNRFSQRIAGLVALGIASTFAMDQARAVTTYVSGKEGRFVVVQNFNSSNRLLHTSEIEAFLANVTPNGAGVSGLSTNDVAASFELEGALGSFAFQHGSSSALTDNAQQTAGATYTRSGVGALYAVDLGSTQNVGSVRTWQRFDGCCQERLSNFNVLLLADDGTGNPGDLIASKVVAGQVATNSFASVAFTSKIINPGGAGTIGTDTELGTDAQYIKVTTAGTSDTFNQFHIGEIQAFDTSATNIALGSAGSIATTLDGNFVQGSDASLNDGLVDSGVTTWTREGISFAGGFNAGAVVDLNQVRDLTSIVIHQRSDGLSQDRLSNFTVTVESANGIILSTQSFIGVVLDNSFATFNLADLVILEAGDILVIDIDGSTNTSDLLKIGTTGDGELRILDGASLVLNFLSSPAGASTFDVLDFGLVSGTFSTISVVGFDADKINLSNLLITGQISVAAIPEPVTGLLTLGGFALLGLRTRRGRIG